MIVVGKNLQNRNIVIKVINLVYLVNILLQSGYSYSLGDPCLPVSHDPVAMV